MKKERNDTPYVQRREARPPVEFFAPKVNQTVIDKALQQVETLQKEIDELRGYFSETVSQTIKRLMESKKWKSSIFQSKTGLNQGLFRKISTIQDKKLSLPVIISICVGLCLPQEISKQLINQAGYALSANSIEGIIYTRIISGVLPYDIPAINAVIDEIELKNPGEKIRRLGSQFYDGHSKGED